MTALQIVSKQRGGQSIDGVDSRDVARILGKHHHHLIRDIRGYVKAIMEEPNLVTPKEFFVEDIYHVDNSNKEYVRYILTKKGCDMVANKMTGKKGVLFTAAYVDAFHKMKKTISTGNVLDVIDPRFAAMIPKNFSECLRAYAEEVDQHEKTREVLEKTTNELNGVRPKALYYDELVDTNLLTNFRDTAKELRVRPLDLTNLLILKKYIYYDKFRRIKPYAKKAGYFQMREYSDKRCSGVQTMITTAGREAIRRLVEKEGLKRVS